MTMPEDVLCFLLVIEFLPLVSKQNDLTMIAAVA
jgi:hypothetical protein